MSGTPTTARAALEAAAALARARDLAGAVALLDTFVAEAGDAVPVPPTIFLKRAHYRNALRDWRGAEADARRAIALLAGARSDSVAMAEASAELGEAAWRVHGAAAALPPYIRCRQIYERRGASPARLARAYDNEALCLHALGRNETAKRRQRQGLDLATKHGLHDRRRSLLRRMANIMQDEGHEDRAARLLDAARPPARAPARERLGWHHSRALLAERQGEPALAEQHYDRATDLFEDNHDRVADMVACLLNAALLKLDLESRAQARRLLDAAERLAPADPPTAYFVKRGIGDALLAAADGRLADASAMFEEVRRRARLRNPGHHAYEADIVARHAGLLHRHGDAGAARALLESLVPDGAIPSGAEQAALELVELRLGQEAGLATTEVLLRQLFTDLLPLADHDTRWRLYSASAEVAARAGREDTAILFGKLAVVEIAASLASFPPDAHEHQALLAERQAPFMAVFRRLVAAGRLVEASRIQALHQIERARALVMRRRPNAPDPALAVMTDDEVDRRDALSDLLAATRRAAATAADALASRRRRQEATAACEALVTALASHFDAALDPLSPTPGRGGEDLPTAADELPRPGSVILRYFVDDGRTMLQAVSARGAVVRALPIARTDLLSAVYRFVEALRRGAPVEDEGRILHDMLVAPVAAELEGAAVVEIVADGGLAALPFAALHDGTDHLVRRFAFGYRSGVPDDGGPGGRKRRRPALFGMSKAAGGLPALACVPVELKGVARALPGARRWRDRRFTARALRGALAEGADIVHIATHHHLVPGSPTRSFLLLGDGERLPIAGFFSGHFAWAGVDLVFLSGCETAAGDTTFEGGDTMAAAFHQAGVADVVATVWPAADEAASRLAPRFYREIAGGAPRAEALRRAQLALLAGDVEDTGEAASIQGEAMRHPAHWAPFKLFVRGR